MGFSITCAVYGGILTILYSISIALYQDDNYDSDTGRRRSRRNSNYDAQMAIASIMLILGVVEFAIAIWAAVYVRHLMRTKTCCSSTPPQQVSLPLKKKTSDQPLVSQ